MDEWDRHTHPLLATVWSRRGQPVLVMDNVSYQRASVVRTLCSEWQGRVAPFWLSVDTPNLNLIERMWRYLKQKLACHRFWNDVAGLEAAATSLLGRIEARLPTDDPLGIRLCQNFCDCPEYSATLCLQL